MRRRKLAIPGSPVRTTWIDAQKPGVDERIQKRLAQCPLDTAKPLCLFKCESQAGHFQILGPETSEQ